MPEDLQNGKLVEDKRWRAGARRSELLSTCLQNFEVGRLYLDESSLSEKSRLIHYYEGIATSLRGKRSEHLLKMSLDHFKKAGAIDRDPGFENQDDGLARATLAIEAQYNSLVIKHRLACLEHETARPGKNLALPEVAEEYSKLIKNCEAFRPSSAIAGVLIAAMFGRLLAEFKWITNPKFNSSEDGAQVTSLKIRIQEFCEVLSARKIELNASSKRDAQTPRDSAADSAKLWSRITQVFKKAPGDSKVLSVPQDESLQIIILIEGESERMLSALTMHNGRI